MSEFMRMRPPTFSGSTEPMDADDWYTAADATQKTTTTSAVYNRFGEVTRRAYRHDGSFFSFLVSDDMNFEGRVPFVAEVKSQRAWIFSSPEAAGPTDRYLKVGDKVTFLNVKSVRGQEWVEFRFSEDSSPEGWLKCSDVGGCDFG